MKLSCGSCLLWKNLCRTVLTTSDELRYIFDVSFVAKSYPEAVPFVADKVSHSANYRRHVLVLCA